MPFITSETSREALYVAATRARHRTHLYVTTESIDLAAGEHPPTSPSSAYEVLTHSLVVESAHRSATEPIRHSLGAADAHGLDRSRRPSAPRQQATTATSQRTATLPPSQPESSRDRVRSSSRQTR